MDKVSATSGLTALTPVLAAALLLAGSPDPAAAASTAVLQSPCPGTIQVEGRTAQLTAFVCGSVTASVGTPWPISIGVTVGHCTGCECGYVWEGAAGSQFTRRGAGECGWGSPGGGGSGGDGDGGSELDNDGCQWGTDYVGWEPRGC